MVKNIRLELALRKNFLSGEVVNTIYFGGGTPSILPTNEIYNILNDIYTLFPVKQNPEISLEANPDDLNISKLSELRSAGINRLSIGVQSFDNAVLKYLNRSHDSESANKSFVLARECGFNNISIDLIYAIYPGYYPVLKEDIVNINELSPEHVSAYCLTIENQTVFGDRIKKGKLHKCDEEEEAIEYEYIIDALTNAGYDHYEISNFAREGFLSVHNTNYWLNEKYLGIGPSAHSYDQVNRYYNISNNAVYNNNLENSKIPESVDYLSMKDRINEYIMLSLRTKWGCDLEYIQNKYGFTADSGLKDYLNLSIKNGYMILEGGIIQLTQKGKLIADKVASELFIA